MHFKMNQVKSKDILLFSLLMILTFIFVPIMVKDKLNQLLIHFGLSAFVASVYVGLCIAIILVVGGYFLLVKPYHTTWSEVGFKPFSIKKVPWLLLMTIICFGASVLSYIISVYLGAPESNTKTPILQEVDTWYSYFVVFIMAVIVSPLYEEIFYRGMIYGFLRKRINRTISLSINAVLFSIAHWPNWNILLLNLINGLLFGYVYEKTNSVYASFIVHGLINLCVLLVAV
jgi:membrane protease YdiL (CAAX protease family)